MQFERIKRFFTLHTVSSKLIIGTIFSCLIMVAIIEHAFDVSLNYLGEKQISEREKTDLLLLEKSLGDGNWSIRDNCLYKGNIRMGDGTLSNANNSLFEEFEMNTGTFACVWKKCSDGQLVCVSRSANDTNEKDIVGSYLDKSIANKLQIENSFIGTYNIQGSSNHCFYKGIQDSTKSIIGCIIVGHSASEIQAEADKAKKQVNFVLINLILLSNIGLIVFFSRMSKNIETIKEYLQKIGTGEFPQERLTIRSRDEIEDVAKKINEMVDSLRDKERIGAELNIASKIQTAMLSKKFPDKSIIDLHAIMMPAKEVGGDFYDFEVQGNNVYFAIGDVSGKGVPAAIVMAITKSAIRMYRGMKLSIDEIVSKINNSISKGNEVGMFVTLFIGKINLTTLEFEFCNAGHNPIVVISPQGKATFLNTKANLAIGILEDFQYEGQKITLEKGTCLALYTDGVTEAEKANKEQYGNERLLAWAENNSHSSAVNACNNLYEDVLQFAEGNEQYDDITIMTMKV